VVLIHGVRWIKDLAYSEFISEELPSHEFFADLVRDKLIYYPTVTREPFRHQGRITQLVDSGRLFSRHWPATVRPGARPRDGLRQPGDDQGLLRPARQRGFQVSPYIGAQGDYVIERAFVDK
jgi:ferredoxin--NADP+ reductase